MDEISKTCTTRQKHTAMLHITPANSWDEFVSLLDGKGGFVSAHWDGTAESKKPSKRKPRQRSVAYHSIIRQKPEPHSLPESRFSQRVLFARASIDSKGCQVSLSFLKGYLSIFGIVKQPTKPNYAFCSTCGTAKPGRARAAVRRSLTAAPGSAAAVVNPVSPAGPKPAGMVLAHIGFWGAC